MKKLLLIAASALFTVGTFAQDNAGENQEPTWTLTVKRTDVEPNGDGDVYTMTATGTQVDGCDAYSVTVPLDVVGTNKPAKYWLTVTYTSADGATTYSAAYSKSAYQLQAPAEPITLTVGAYLQGGKNIRAVYSINNYCIGDANYRALAVFEPTAGGNPVSCYFNAPRTGRNEFKPAGSINYASTTVQYITGASVNAFSFSQNKVEQGIYIVGLDYSTPMMTIAKAETIELPIVESAPRVAFRPFVCAADVIIPDGLWVYTLTYDPAKPAELKAVPYEMTGRVLPANTPVILKASVKSIWTGDTDVYSLAIVPDSYDYKLDNGGVSPTYIYDSKTEGNVLVGVNQPHLVPEGAYMLHDMVYMPKTDGEIVHQFDCYVQLPDTGTAVADETDSPDADPYLSINFPIEDEDAVITGVDAISIDVPATDTPAYDIYGRRVAPGYRGIVIRGGKKLYQN